MVPLNPRTGKVIPFGRSDPAMFGTTRMPCAQDGKCSPPTLRKSPVAINLLTEFRPMVRGLCGRLRPGQRVLICINVQGEISRHIVVQIGIAT